ncbi:hypothetical protein BH20BAC1_BH20BAC1_11180 [soil metagenome]
MNLLKIFVLFLILSGIFLRSPAQRGTDSTISAIDSSKVVGNSNQPDSFNIDSLAVSRSDLSVMNKWLTKNKFINTAPGTEFVVIKGKTFSGKEFLFYLLCLVALILGLFKTFYKGYFNNLFRVFLNTSLRQNQLTDQLQQAKLPSFILNIFFAVTAGIYLWLAFSYFYPGSTVKGKPLLLLCIGGIGALYLVKFLSLKFLGWLYTLQEEVNNYIFIIFLINKIAGIILVPLIFVLAFSKPLVMQYVNLICILVLGLFLITRYIKTYGSLDRRVSINAFHFVIYVLAIEIVPLMLVYKVTVDYLI